MDKNKLYFAALNPVQQINIPEAKEVEVHGKDFISWGADNKYCDFLYRLYTDSPSVQTIVNGTVDFVTGSKVETNSPIKSRDIEDIVALAMTDYLVFGALTLVVYRNKLGKVVDTDWIDIRHLRSNKKNDVFFYSEDWNKSYGRVKTIIYPKYIEGGKDLVSILMVKNPQSRSTYPLCPWSSAVRSATIETEISKFHLNEISNNFTASAIVNFNNGVPDDKQKEEIEEMMSEKFGGAENAGRFLLSFNANKENATTIERLDADNFDERYTNLEKSTKQQIFTAFRAVPALFGLMTETTGFSSQEFSEAFELYNKTRVKPLQNVFVRAWERIWGENSLRITPFEVEKSEEE